MNVTDNYVDVEEEDGSPVSLRRGVLPVRARPHKGGKPIVSLTFEDGITLRVRASWAELRLHLELPFDLPIPPIRTGGRSKRKDPEPADPTTHEG